MIFSTDDLSRYNHAESPHFTVYPNGKIDIGPKQGTVEQRIGLSSTGMFNMVNEWLSSSGLNAKQKNKLIEKLNK